MLDQFNATWGFALGAIAAVTLFLMFVGVVSAVIRVCPPNMVMVVTGAKTTVEGKSIGFRIQKGGWTTVMPYFQQAQLLDFCIVPINVRVEGINSANGITVGADATAFICVAAENNLLLYAAVERLMGKSRREIQDQIQQTMIGNFLGALNKTTRLEDIGMVESVAQINTGQLPESIDEVSVLEEGERAQFRQEILRDSNEELRAFEMQVVSVSLQKIWDTSNHIANLAKNQTDERIVEAREKLEVTRRLCEAEIERARLEADGAIAKAQNRGERTVQQAMIELQKLRNISEVTLRTEIEQQAAKVLATGKSQAIHIFEGTKNELLKQKTPMATQFGDAGRFVFFVQQHLPSLFKVYQENTNRVKLDHLVAMEDENGLDRVVNRGPLAMQTF